MKNNSPTEAGQTKAPQNELIDALNQVFALFKLNYHNQFLKAFAQQHDLNAIKRLWLDSLSSYTAITILEAAKAIIKSSEYLPTLKTMLSHCERLSNRSLPELRTAYAEACNAASPKLEQAWSHPAVYLAGRDVGWHFLQSSAENVAFPVFKERYLSLSERVRAGEKLSMPTPPKQTMLEQKPASAETSKKYLHKLQSLFDEGEEL